MLRVHGKRQRLSGAGYLKYIRRSTQFDANNKNIGSSSHLVCNVRSGGDWPYFKGIADQSQEKPTFVRALGKQVLTDSLINKGSAFLRSERERFHLRGLLPHKYVSLEEQVTKTLDEFREGMWDQAARDPGDEMIKAGLTPDNIRKWRFLSDIQENNETLFYRTLIDNFEEMASIVYTPTVGWACINYSRLIRSPRGMYFTARDTGQMLSLVYNWPSHQVDAIVVTDGSRILGLGDLGMNGMGISIGKLDLYVAAAGFHPSKVLPCVIDVGTNNEALRHDRSYLGLDQPRLEGDEYLRVIDEFIGACKTRWPNVLIQFEDFRSEVAKELLDRYRDDHLCFNDDIQGTACTALAGIYGSLGVQGLPHSAIKDMKFVVCGAGSAGLGVVSWLAEAMIKHGLSEEAAYSNFHIIDKGGLVTVARGGELKGTITKFARKELAMEGLSTESVIAKVKPDALLGLSGAGRIWKEETIRTLAAGVKRPLVFPMSNPTSRSECSAQDCANWTEGRGIFASGSPFPNARYDGKEIISSQGNNLYIFPGLALGGKIAQATRITDAMLMAASEALASCVTVEDLKKGKVYPGLHDIRSISNAVACAVVTTACAEGVATNQEAYAMVGEGPESVRLHISNFMYNPSYNPLVYVEKGVLE